LIISNKTGHVQGVNAAVCELTGHASHRRIIAPAHTWIVGIGGIAVVAVAEVGDDQADFADFTRAHHMAHFAHHRVGV